MSRPIPSSDSRRLPVYYLSKKNSYFYFNPHFNVWQQITSTDLEGRLVALGYDKRGKDGNNSETKTEMLRIQQEMAIDAVCNLGWLEAGFHEAEGQRLLVTKGCRLIEPVKGTWPTIKEVIDLQLSHAPEQVTRLHSWGKWGLMGLYDKNIRPGQALIFVGPVKCGKSLIQDRLFTPMFGGRTAHPYDFMTKSTDFNSDLFEAVHLNIQDKNHLATPTARKSFGAVMKEMTANAIQRLHEKGMPAFSVRPHWRISMSINDEQDNLAILPQLENSLLDKMLIFKCEKKPLPNVELNEAFERELPAYLWWLRNDFQIPSDISDNRFGVQGYAHPELVTDLESFDNSTSLLKHMESCWAGVKHEKIPLIRLMGLLELTSPARALNYLLNHENKMGSALHALAERDERIKYFRTSKGRYWTVDFT